jgi:hypothetical protein
MEVRDLFGHREWWLRRPLWWFTRNISGIRKCFRNLRTVYEFHFRELMTGVILTSENHG